MGSALKVEGVYVQTGNSWTLSWSRVGLDLTFRQQWEVVGFWAGGGRAPGGSKGICSEMELNDEGRDEGRPASRMLQKVHGNTEFKEDVGVKVVVLWHVFATNCVKTDRVLDEKGEERACGCSKDSRCV